MMPNDIKKKPVIREKGIIEIRGNRFLNYDTMLDYGHQIGIQSLIVTLIQLPNSTNDNTAICQATLQTSAGQVFTDIGDASPSNSPGTAKNSFIRIASTRAKGRVISDAFNISSALNDPEGGAKENGNIIEADFIVVNSGGIQNHQKAIPAPSPPATQKQIGYINFIAKKLGISPENLVRERLQKDIPELSVGEAKNLISSLKDENDGSTGF